MDSNDSNVGSEDLSQQVIVMLSELRDAVCLENTHDSLETFTTSPTPNEIPKCHDDNFSKPQPNGPTQSSPVLDDPNNIGGESIKMFVGQIPKNMQENDIQDLVQGFGTVANILILRDKRTGESRGCCFITFESRRCALEFQLAWHDIKILAGMRHPIQIKPANELSKNVRKLFIGNLGKEILESDIIEQFSSCGTVQECVILKGSHNESKGCAFIIFSTSEEANAAISKFNRSTFENSTMPLVVKLADSKKAKEIKRFKKTLEIGNGVSGTHSSLSPDIQVQGYLKSNIEQYYNNQRNMNTSHLHRYSYKHHHHNLHSILNDNKSSKNFNNVSESSNSSNEDSDAYKSLESNHVRSNLVQQVKRPRDIDTCCTEFHAHHKNPRYIAYEQRADHKRLPSCGDDIEERIKETLHILSRCPTNNGGKLYETANDDVFELLLAKLLDSNQSNGRLSKASPVIMDREKSWNDLHIENIKGTLTKMQRNVRSKCNGTRFGPGINHMDTLLDILSDKLAEKIIKQNNTPTFDFPKDFKESNDVYPNIRQTDTPPKQFEGPNGANLFIYHLQPQIKDNDLMKLFEPFGDILSTKVFVDKRTGLSKCFGFVSYSHPSSANDAIKQMNGRQFGAKTLKVELKKQRF